MYRRMKRLSLAAALVVVPVVAMAPAAGAGAITDDKGPVAGMSAVCAAAGGEPRFGPYGVTCSGPDGAGLPQAWITLCETGLAQFYSSPAWNPYITSDTGSWVCYSPFAP